MKKSKKGLLSVVAAASIALLSQSCTSGSNEQKAPDIKQLLTEAITVAESLAAIRPELYALSKQQARQPTREAIDSRTGLDEAEIVALWESAETRASVQAFVDRTLK